jgi:hypothetical protein
MTFRDFFEFFANYTLDVWATGAWPLAFYLSVRCLTPVIAYVFQMTCYRMTNNSPTTIRQPPPVLPPQLARNF